MLKKYLKSTFFCWAGIVKKTHKIETFSGFQKKLNFREEKNPKNQFYDKSSGFQKKLNFREKKVQKINFLTKPQDFKKSKILGRRKVQKINFLRNI